MTEPSHSDIYRIVGHIEGQLEGILQAIQNNADKSRSIETSLSERLDKLDDRLNNGEVWQAEVRGMSRGVKYGLVLAAGVTGAAGAKGIEWVMGKLL